MAVPSGPFTPPASGPPPDINTIVGPVASQAAASTDELFAGLLELSWKEVSIPYSRLTFEFRHDLAIHKFVDRDGAHVEATGRGPIEITARVPMINGLDQGPNEHWQRPLYPFTRDKLLKVALDRTSGTLQHPEFGPITCKLERIRWELDAAVRGGVWIDISWIETDDDATNSIDEALASPSPLANAQAAANDLTFQLSTVDPNVVPQPYVPTIGFDDLMNAIRGVVDTPTLLQKQYAGRVDNIIYEANALESSLNASASALNWPMIESAERIKDAAYALKATLLTKGRQVSFYTVQKDSTLAQIAAQIPAPVGQLIQLNPAYMSSPLIPASSVVRYYS